MNFEKTSVMAEMDPRLQWCVERHQRGLTPAATASTEAGEVAVIAKVADPVAWQSLSEVREGAYLGGGEELGGWLVTGRVPVSRLEHVRRQVISLKAAQGVRPALTATVQEIEASLDRLPPGSDGRQGAGVIVGIVDFGCDFAHQNFRNADGTTRLLAIWDQAGVATPTSPFGYGRVYNRDDINQALGAADPYAALGYGPTPDTPQSRGNHGTHVMDIAAGNGRGSGVTGVAPEADLIFVELSASDIPWQSSSVVDSTFGDSVQLAEAMQFIVQQAAGRPCVINLSLGTNGGPHDGSTLVEQGIDVLVTGAVNRAIVVAASNSHEDGIHASGTMEEGGAVDLLWSIPIADFTHNEMEIWYPGADDFRLEILLPNGTSIGSVGLGENARVHDDTGKTILFVAHRRGDPNNGDNVIGVFLESGLPTGTWTMRLHGLRVTNGAFHAWIERDDNSPSQFVAPHDNAFTLGSISCGRHSIVVGSYDAHKTVLPLSWFSSAGPTRDGREKPELSAPGHDVMAAHSRTSTGITRKSGTSMAAPAVAGVVALMLSNAHARGVTLTAQQIRDLLLGGARRTPPDGTKWHPRYGLGRLHARAAVEAVATVGPAPQRPPAPRRGKAGRSAESSGTRRTSPRARKP